MRERDRDTLKMFLKEYKNHGEHDVTIPEFEFYNNHMKIMTKEELTQFVNLAKNNDYKPVFYTNEKIAEENIILSFCLKIKNEQEVAGKPVIENAVYVKSIKLDFKFDVNDILGMKFLVGKVLMIAYDMSLEDYLRVCRYHSSYLESSYMRNEFHFYVKSKDELKNILITNDLISKERFVNSEENVPVDIAKYLFDLDLKVPKYKSVRNVYSSPDGINHIFKVIEERIDGKNYRIAFIADIDYYSQKHYISIFPESHPDYNCIDEKRMFIDTSRSRVFLDISSTKYITENDWNPYTKKEEPVEYIEINMDVFDRVIRDIRTILPQGQNVLTAHIFNFYYERYKGGSRSIKENNRNIKNEIDVRLKALLLAGKEIKIGDCVISQKGLKVNEDSFTMEFGKNFIDFEGIDIYYIRNALDIRNAQYNFNSIYEKILEMSKLSIIKRSNVRTDEYRNFKEVCFKVNNIDIKVKREGDRIYINDIFCRIDDWENIVNKAICYTNEADFNRYMTDVSHIGVEYKQMIANGVSIHLYNPFNNIFKNDKFGEKITIRFSLLWDIKNRSKIYLKLNDKKYLIQNKVKFRKHFNFPSITLSINEIWTHLNECIGTINSDMFISILNNAIEEGAIVKKRGEELVRLTIEETGAEDTTIDYSGRQLFGYLVVGIKSGSKYFILKNDLDVYKLKDGQWNRRCVVDRSDRQRIYEDRLANRLINIRNEPSFISTIHN